MTDFGRKPKQPHQLIRRTSISFSCEDLSASATKWPMGSPCP